MLLGSCVAVMIKILNAMSPALAEKSEGPRSAPKTKITYNQKRTLNTGRTPNTGEKQQKRTPNASRTPNTGKQKTKKRTPNTGRTGNVDMTVTLPPLLLPPTSAARTGIK